ncbi:hypothetical protein H4219_004580 [Mycoemilia scoparia]|uniref:Uncharacterized protein n=1 Tax=Mycoemilia scoparia TaxID=417184 RepID=A0A9W8DMM0_9FUNG|nr:hypothetical protein H4219_004580 [Mycoemilia scoparia]
MLEKDKIVFNLFNFAAQFGEYHRFSLRVITELTSVHYADLKYVKTPATTHPTTKKGDVDGVYVRVTDDEGKLKIFKFFQGYLFSKANSIIKFYKITHVIEKGILLNHFKYCYEMLIEGKHVYNDVDDAATTLDGNYRAYLRPLRINGCRKNITSRFSARRKITAIPKSPSSLPLESDFLDSRLQDHPGTILKEVGPSNDQADQANKNVDGGIIDLFFIHFIDCVTKEKKLEKWF